MENEDYLLPDDFALPPDVTTEVESTPETFAPSLTPQTTNVWDPRLILDLAIGVDGVEEILTRYDLSEQEFNVLSETKPFRRELALAMRDVRENGIPFTQKAKVQAESYLEVLDKIVYNTETPASVRLECIRSAVRWGKLEPEKATKDDGLSATQINVNISF